MDNYALLGKEGQAFLDKSTRYFELLAENPQKIGSAEDYLDFVGLTFPEAEEYCKGKRSEDTRYKKIARRLSEDANRIRRHYATSIAWNEKMTATKSMFLLKQRLWDGLSLSDQPQQKQSRNVTVNLVFGGKSNKSEWFK